MFNNGVDCFPVLKIAQGNSYKLFREFYISAGEDTIPGN